MKSVVLTLSLCLALSSHIAVADVSKATFAGGCFWCMEHAFDGIIGVVSTRVGFIGGSTQNPTYFQVSNGGTGHTEAVEVAFEDKQISYGDLLKIFWKNVDPIDPGGQFCDRGDQYRSGIFYHSEVQKTQADASKQALQKNAQFTDRIAVEVSAASTFTAAEKYHQQYYRKNPIRYKFYRYSCGRDQRLNTLWAADKAH
ncbi:MAG: peptide-methionine (S)-S-oxide reductase MsrA [Motiliproteus sp.]